MKTLAHKDTSAPLGAEPLAEEPVIPASDGSTLTPVVGLIVLSTLYLLFGSLYATLIPTWQSPDEPSHYLFVESLATVGSIPVVTVEERYYYEAFQPPAYYLVLTPVYRFFGEADLRTRLVAMRVASLLMGLPLIPLAYFIASRVTPSRWAPSRRWVGFGSAGVVALVPQHIAINSSVNNDVISTLAASGALLAVLYYIQRASRLSAKDLLLLGLLVGGAVMAKSTAIWVAPLVSMGTIIAGRRGGQSWGRILLGLMLIGGIALAIASPWLIRNIQVYGEPVGYSRHEEINAVASLQRWEDIPNAGRLFVTSTFASFWLLLGWMTTKASNATYQLLAIIAVVGAAGFIPVMIQQFGAWIRREPNRLVELLTMLVLIGGTLSLVMWFALTQFFQAQGRYLFPALASMAPLFVLGFRWWLPHRIFGVFVFVGVLGLIYLNFYAVTVVVPALPPEFCPFRCG